jgi:acyl dehydratase
VTLDPTKVGHRTEPHRVSYVDRDVLLYNLAIGAEAGRDLPLLYEGLGPKVVPSFAVILAWPAVEELFDVVMGGDLSGIVHGAQAIRVHRPIPPAAEVQTTGRIEGLYDLKRLAVSILSTETRTLEGELLAETEWEIVHLTEGGFGGEKPPKKSRPQKPSAAPLFEVEVKTHAEQALLYRLTGDRNPLHADPEFAKKVGFERPILHGLCTFGVVARVLARELGDNDPARLRSLRGQFVKPVFPGETLVVRAHRLDEGVRVEAEVREREEVVFGFGLAELTE